MLFLTQLYTGLRGAEGCDVRVNQVCSIDKKGRISIFPVLQMDKVQMKGGKKGRQIHLPATLQEALKEYLDKYSELYGVKLTTATFVLPLTEQELYQENCRRYKKKIPQLKEEDGPHTQEYALQLFPSQKCAGRKGLISLSRGSWHDIFKEVCRRNGIVGAKRTIGTHCLRKTYVCDLYNSEEMKRNPLLLMRCTGHSRFETLQAYVNIHDENVERAQHNVLSDLTSLRTMEERKTLPCLIDDREDEDFR